MTTPITSISQPDSQVNQAHGVFQRVTQAIKQASARTGVDFSYLLNKATQESNLNPNAQSSGSSATGLFQFTGQTWLQMVKTQGSQYGLSQYADHISIDKNGVAHASDNSWKHAILALRKDPTLSAEMAGELDKQNMASLKTDVGGKIGATDLYMAHFLGAGGATDFLNALRSNPKASAASIVPDAAAANHSVFYDKSGAPRSLGQVYQHFAQKFDHAPNIMDSGSPTLVASNTLPTAPSLASLGNTEASNISGTPNYSLPVLNSSLPQTSSLFTAMTIAQMDLKSMVNSSLQGADPTHKKSAASVGLEPIA